MGDYILDLKDNLSSIEFCLNEGISTEIIKSGKLLAKLDILEESLIDKANRYKSGLDIIIKSNENSLSKKTEESITDILYCIYQIGEIERKVETRECKVTNHVKEFIQNV